METISQLKGKVAQLEAWNTEKNRYRKVEVAPGVIAYALKQDEDREPAHYACTDCYRDNRISILKPETWDPGRCKVLSCHRCGSALYLVGAMWPEHQKYRSHPSLEGCHGAPNSRWPLASAALPVCGRACTRSRSGGAGSGRNCCRRS